MDKPVVRETYLDILKGLAMLLVVMQHVGGGLNEGITFLYKVDVPLFFVVSGYLVMKSDISICSEMVKKTKRIGVPFVVCFIFAAFWYGRDVLDILLHDIGKCGYWFLLCLFLFYMMFYAFHKLFLANGGMRRTAFVVVNCAIEVLLLALSKFAPEVVDNVIGFSYMSRYYLCFMMGVYIRLYGVERLNRTVGSLMLVAACVAFTYKGANSNVSFLLYVIGYMCASACVFYFIRSITPPKFISAVFCTIGRNSLAVYVLHFYFVVNITQSTGHFTTDVVLVWAVSLVVIALSIVLQKFLVAVTHLDKVL